MLIYQVKQYLYHIYTPYFHTQLMAPSPPSSLLLYTGYIEPTNKVTVTPSSTPTSGLRRMTPRILDSEYIYISMWLMLVWGLLKSNGSQTTNMIDINVIQVNGNRQREIVNYCILPTTPPGNKHWRHSLSACDRLTYQGERATWPKCLHTIKMHNEKYTIRCFFTLIICCEYS